MNNTKKQETKTPASKEEKNMKNNSIIDVVVNGMTATEALNEVNTRLETVEKSVFNIALLTSYGCGVKIPAYTDNKGIEHAEACCEKPMKQKDFITLVNRSSRTISRWKIAMDLIIEKNRFNDFATGLYPFSYDKIIAIFRNEKAFEGTILSDLMKMSAKSLETVAEEYNKKSEGKTSEEGKKAEVKTEKAEAKNETEAPVKEDSEGGSEIATLTYNGKEYKVNKVIFEKWLAENMIAD
jgi:hypothetical protein